MPTTRAAARPDRQQHLENAALRNRVKKSYEKAQQEEALKELLQLIGANGGKAPYGAIDNLVKKYHLNGFKAVTRQNLYYRLEKIKKDAVASESIIGKDLSINLENTTSTSNSAAEVSDLTEPSANLINEANESTSSTTINCGGRKKYQCEQLSLPCQKRKKK
jgi:hypothetical protein